ncbi:hypothetical protein HBI46_037710 [Parastagonospora nodorum]|nr:hypothetical protein HBH47_210190 [Parastagonospora nodorum]KAH5425714.1 hypothetical protein HBI46_037710 [Parastagonospora nodorum]KAH5492107.1 hypothetical protein HBI31_120410 [Parastagonospora nodorum]
MKKLLQIRFSRGSLPLHTPRLLPLPKRHNTHPQPLSLQHIHNPRPSLPKHNPLFLPAPIPNLIKRPPPPPKKPLKNLLPNFLLAHNPSLHPHLQRIQHIPQRIWLRKHACRDFVPAPLAPLRMRRAIRAQEELAPAAHDSLKQGVAVLGRLGHGLAEAERITRPIVDNEGEMVRGDGASDAGPACAHGVEGGGGAAVFEDDAEVGESGVQGFKSREEGGLGVEDGDGSCVFGVGGGGRGGGDFAVKIEDHVLRFHFGEDGVEGLVV